MYRTLQTRSPFYRLHQMHDLQSGKTEKLEDPYSAGVLGIVPNTCSGWDRDYPCGTGHVSTKCDGDTRTSQNV